MDSQSRAIVPSMPRGVARIEPDGPRYANIFHVNSETSDRVYRVSFDKAVGAWVCSCRGQIAHLCCKHIESLGLRPTRRDIMQQRVADKPQYKKLK